VTNPRLPDIYQVSGLLATTDGPRRELQLNGSREERFRSLYERHVEVVARYVARRTAANDVQDVVADTFLTAWRRFDELPQDPIPWLLVTARKLIANRHRSTGRRAALYDKLAAGSPWNFESTTPELSEIDQGLLAAIAQLPEAQREAFMLVAWDGLDVQRASRAAGCSAATFRMRLHRARRRLKQKIGSPRPFVPITETSLEESR
jgi:RNA polymerase sigma-70 factor, ECF subfamily